MSDSMDIPPDCESSHEDEEPYLSEKAVKMIDSSYFAVGVSFQIKTGSFLFFFKLLISCPPLVQRHRSF